MRFIHIADVHANRARKPQVIDLLLQVKNLAEKLKAFVIFAGDFWDSTITNTENSGFSEFVRAVDEICSVTKVFMVYGTQSHEPNGSLEVFKTVGAEVYSDNTFISNDDCQILFMPEPRKYKFAESALTFEEAVQNSYSEAIENAMQKRKDGKPFIVVYHGELTGSTFQNGAAVDSEVSLSKGLLSSLNADYYALGHIHKPQEVFKNCFYAGSPYPKDFGETHDGGCNIVTIENGMTKVERYSFNLPVNVTVETDMEGISSLYAEDFSRKNLSVKVKIDKLLKKNFDIAKLSQDIKDATNANFVKVKMEYIKAENVRAEEISNKERISDKFKFYAELNHIRYSDTLIEKLHAIQEKMSSDSFVPCDTFELEYISLKGAIGIKDGTGRDEIEIDFTKFDNGIVALIGDNGRGKTTLIENCHPYPQMLTRSGSLKDHFCLHKSHRILVYRMSSGKKLRITMLIDGTAKCAMTKYFVETKGVNDEDYKPYVECDGGYNSYMNFVNSTFGSIDIFLRTSFYAKEQIKSVPDLARATRSERFYLFSMLSGVDYLSFVSEKAKAESKLIQEQMTRIENDISGYDKLKKQVESFALKETQSKEKLSALKEDFAVLQKEYDDIKQKQNVFENAMYSYESKRVDFINKTRELQEYESEYDEVKGEKDSLLGLLKNKDVYEKQYAWYEEHLKIRSDLQKKVMKLTDDINSLSAKISSENTKLYKSKDSEIILSGKLVKLETEIKGVVVPVFTDVCYACGQKLTEEQQKKQKDEITAIENHLSELEEQRSNVESELNELKAEAQKVKDTVSELESQQILLSGDVCSARDDILQIDSYIEDLDIDVIKETLFHSEVTLKELEKRENKILSKVTALKADIGKLEESLNNMPKDYSKELLECEIELDQTRSKIDTEKAVLSFLKEQEDEFCRQSKELDANKNMLKALKKDLSDYAIIQKAFSTDGIQVLELDSAIPEIEDITNNILYDSYDDRFTVSFETQRSSADGRKIEDFIINVFDNNSGRVKKLETLCSGESVWIKQALYYAFSVVRSRKTGFCFKTRFLDETDGSLDTQSRSKYLKMIESAHAACGATLTVIITHSQEIKDIVSQKIEL